MSSNYGEKYFNWQKTVGKFGGHANLFKFEKYIKNNKDVLDFGCGGGYLLKNITTTGRKVGIDINPTARKEAELNGIECKMNLNQIDDNSIDIIISNHALEHIEYPSDILKEFKRILRNNGVVVVVVPHESNKKVDINDRNMHLFSWSPQTLVNLFKQSGLDVISGDSICHQWMPHYQKIQRLVGWKIWHKLCWLYCKFIGKGYQTRVVGTVKKDET